MESIGKILYDARVAKGLTLLDAEKATSIRCSYLDALEQDDYSKLPEEVFIKGIIRNYGNYLGLNGPELVDLYKANKAGIQVDEVKSKGIREVDTVKMNISLKQHRSAGSGVDAYQSPNSKKSLAKQILAGALGVIILVGGYFAMPIAMEWLHSKNAAEEPAVAAVVIPTETKTETKKEEPPVVIPVIENVKVEMIAHGKCWLEVTADGKNIFEGMLNANDVNQFEAKEKLVIKYGNVGVMEVKVNGKPVSMQGEQGVAIKTYTK